MTISLKDKDEIFFSVHFLMPLGIPFHENMVSNHSIFFYFLASQTHRACVLTAQYMLGLGGGRTMRETMHGGISPITFIVTVSLAIPVLDNRSKSYICVNIWQR